MASPPRATPDLWAGLDTVLRAMESNLQTHAAQHRLHSVRTSLQLQQLFPLFSVIPVRVDLLLRPLCTIEVVDLAVTKIGRTWRNGHPACGSTRIVGQWYCALKRLTVSLEKEGCVLVNKHFPEERLGFHGQTPPQLLRLVPQLKSHL